MIDREDEGDRRVEKNPPRRKAPIVNRRGPSEVSRAIQMMSQMNGRSAPPSGRKQSTSAVSRGTVVRMDRGKGYGFLVDSAGEQRFFHRTAVLEDGFDGLSEQQLVEFEPYNDERGARAQKVRPAGTAVREKGAAQPAKPAKPSPKTPKAPAWKSDLSPFRNGSGAPAPGKKRPRV